MSKKSFFRSDKELDDLLRKISDSAEIPFSEEDWGDMKARLDQLPRPAPAWWENKSLVWIGVVAFGILLSLAIWYTIPLTQEPDQIATGLQTPMQPLEIQAETPEPSEIAGINVDKSFDETKPLLPDQTEEGLEAPSIVRFGNRDNIKNTSLDPLAKNFMQKKISGWDNPENKPIQWQRNPIPSLDFVSSLPDSLIPSESNTVTSEIEKTTEKSYPFAGRLGLSVQAAPDLSGIELNQVGKAGQAVGIGAAYFLSPRVSISSGVFYSFKPYSTNGESGQGYGDQPDRIYGECDVLDIPINLRYYPVEGKLQRIFASVGLSSYLMLKEHYELEYEGSGTGYPYTKEIDVSGENKHFFGVVNISAGYERKLGKQLGIQVEPYFKVPISGVGAGDISLKSTGIFVGLNYYPGRK